MTPYVKIAQIGPVGTPLAPMRLLPRCYPERLCRNHKLATNHANSLISLVQAAGLEPARGCPLRILSEAASVLRLPARDLNLKPISFNAILRLECFVARQCVHQISPLLHHPATLGQVFGLIVACPDLVPFCMGQLSLNDISADAHLIEDC